MPQDFDIDAELIPTDLDQSTGFVLKAKNEQGKAFSMLRECLEGKESPVAYVVIAGRFLCIMRYMPSN